LLIHAVGILVWLNGPTSGQRRAEQDWRLEPPPLSACSSSALPLWAGNGLRSWHECSDWGPVMSATCRPILFCSDITVPRHAMLAEQRGAAFLAAPSSHGSRLLLISLSHADCPVKHQRQETGTEERDGLTNSPTVDSTQHRDVHACRSGKGTGIPGKLVRTWTAPTNGCGCSTWGSPAPRRT